MRKRNPGGRESNMEDFSINDVNPYSSDKCKECPNRSYCSMNRLICKEYQEYLEEWRHTVFGNKHEK